MGNFLIPKRLFECLSCPYDYFFISKKARSIDIFPFLVITTTQVARWLLLMGGQKTATNWWQDTY
ncbi:Uncharacterised protein [Serratia entomophila]|nr:Uncharacterised protein [Serratia entomophila]